MLPDLKEDFSLFLLADPQRLHFAAHSHHYWPNITFEAHKQAWLDAARLADAKWGHVFGAIMPDVRRGIADILKLPDPETVCFAPSTHDFVLRILSCFPAGKPVRILTSDSEFYSFDRQSRRLEQDGMVQVTRIPSEPFVDFTERFTAAAKDVDLIFVSQVFFNSGFVVTPLEKIVAAAPKDALVVIDGYHGFMAVPTDLSRISDRAFYMAGGYKYAMAGEGACFMHCPPGYGLQPGNTGWFAEMDSLAAKKTGNVDYAPGGARFFGATFDPTGLYRMRAVFHWLKQRGLTVETLHAHAHDLQEYFMETAPAFLGSLVVPVIDQRRGNFLTFRNDRAGDICEALKKKNVVADSRGDRLRFGFGPYHDKRDVDKLLDALKIL